MHAGDRKSKEVKMALISAKSLNIACSAQKVRLVADLVRNKPIANAVDLLFLR